MRKFEKGQKVFWNDPAGETSGEYKVYDEQKNINNYTTWYGNYINSVISDNTDSNITWSQQMIDYTLTR